MNFRPIPKSVEIRLVAILLVCSCLGAVESLAEMRLWKNAKGSQQIIAEFTELREGVVYLRQVGGKVLKAPLNQLCEEDRNYLSGVEKLGTRFGIKADRRILDYAREAELNTAYAMHRAFAKEVRATFRLVADAPSLKADEWVVFAAQPPDSDGQSVRSQFFPEADKVWESRNGTRRLWRSRIRATNASLQTRFAARLQVEVNLFSRSLVDSADSENVVEPLPESLFDLYTAPTSLIDFPSPGLREWIKEAGLVREEDEGQVDFARRVYRAIQKDFDYSYTAKMDWRASSICGAKESDCGGLSIVFLSVLRLNDVPARLLVGRWAKSAEAGDELEGRPYHQQHVKSEFFAAGVGWVPVDMSLGVGDGESSDPRHFGNDDGDFIALHFDHDIAVDTIHFGPKTVTWLQGINYWVTGSGDLDGAQSEKSWVVTELTE